MKDKKKNKGLTDFNDLHIAAGLDAVRSQVVDAVDRFKSSHGANDEPPAYLNKVPPLPDEESAKPKPAERQPILGGKTESNVFTIDELLKRFLFVAQGGEIWDVSTQRRMKKTAFKDLVKSKSLADEWMQHSGRRDIDDEEVNVVLRRKAAQARAAKFTHDWQHRFLVTDSGELRADIGNAKLVLDNDKEWHGVLGYCEFSYRIIKRKLSPFGGEVGEWTDGDTARLRIWLGEKYRFTPKAADALDAVLVAAEGNRFHPVREYLKGLWWDGTPRIENWLADYMGADRTQYAGLVGSMFLIGAVARVMRPPVKVDNVLIFEGLQGLGKSTALKVLGGDWFTDTPLVLGDKDGFQQLQGVWIIELAELDSFNKAESTKAKQFFGGQSDRYRPSYGRMTQTFHRQCVFAGSTNQDSYLRDATGNRRYWPVMCTKVDADKLSEDRNQLWAEAFQLFCDGATWWPADEHKHLFEGQQEDRFEHDVWEEIVEGWLRGITKDRVLISEIMETALNMQAAQMKPPEQKRVGQIMAHLGWHKMRARVGGKRETGYERPLSWAVPVENNEQDASVEF